jgi:hypothetical protein
MKFYKFLFFQFFIFSKNLGNSVGIPECLTMLFRPHWNNELCPDEY